MAKMKIIAGEKIEMARVFDEAGVALPVTRIQLVDVAGLVVGSDVTISGVSKGKGFAGVVKRHGFHGGPRTHGQSDRERAPGAIGSGTTPGRVLPGKRMAGRMGGTRVTIRGLRVVAVEPEAKILAVLGSVPGPRGMALEIKLAEAVAEVQSDGDQS